MSGNLWDGLIHKRTQCMGYGGYRAASAGKEGVGTLREITWPIGSMEGETGALVAQLILTQQLVKSAVRLVCLCGDPCPRYSNPYQVSACISASVRKVFHLLINQ